MLLKYIDILFNIKYANSYSFSFFLFFFIQQNSSHSYHSRKITQIEKERSKTVTLCRWHNTGENPQDATKKNFTRS